MSAGAAEHYARRRDHAQSEIERLSARSATISIARLVVFAAIVGALAAGKWGRLGTIGYAAAGVFTLIFLVLRAIHERVLSARFRAEALRTWANEGLARIDGTFARDPKPGEPKAPPDHPYADDLDLLARGGLLASLDTTRTAQGRALLASWLISPASPTEIFSRQEAARDLAGRIDFLEALAVEGTAVAEEPPDPTPLIQWAERGSGLVPSVALLVVAWLLPIFTLGYLFFGGSVPGPRGLWIVGLLAQLALLARFRAAIGPGLAAASAHQEGLARFARLFEQIEATRFSAPSLEEMRSALAAGPASREIGRLRNIVGFVDARRNEVFRLLIGPALLWDLHCAIALERWRRRAGRRMGEHLAAIARFEALAALAARAFERPEDAWPEIEPADVSFRATGLAHPLIPEARAVRNDVALDGAGAVLLVTGSNMSGKSTLMRAIGANLVLALAGAPVRARALRTSPFAVWTSMRIRDDLGSGVSHFFAELRRLKAIVDAADGAGRTDEAPASAPVLFLLDEILHGTNSRERHLGAQAVVRRLSTRRAAGAVSTHDLALAALEDELPGRVRNVHFREQVETVDGKETMTFDYRLRPGVVTSSNALRLMRIVGLDVEVPSASVPPP
jgi:ABC-type multidrug transport system fused ATPase/permease subunit